MAAASASAQSIHERPAELLRNLIRFDTTNPPGNERECVSYIQGLIESAGIETKVLGREADRPNLFARIPGRGDAPPLMLYGHVDVVTTEGQRWTHPPFEGVEDDGFLWGRGAVDMKGGVAMMLAAFLRAKANGLAPAGDLIFSAMCDEENLSGYGAKWLVEEHPELFTDIRYAISEFGGFAHDFSGKRFYPIQVAEKQICTLRATVRASGGHGSMPVRDGAMHTLAHALKRLTAKRLPVHVTPVVADMIDAFSEASGRATAIALQQLKRPLLTDRVLDAIGDRGALLDSLLHNTASPTVIKTGSKFNVIPAEISVIIDARMLPGLEPATLVKEVQALVGDDVELEVIHDEPAPPAPDMALYPMLGDILREADPGSLPAPLLMPGISDARFISRLGIQTYGFLPMNLPADFNFWETVHGADERVPIECVAFGTDAIYKALERYTVPA